MSDYTPITNLTARALPAAGAWYTSADAIALLGTWGETHTDTTLTLRVSYTKGVGSSGGYPKVRLEWFKRDDAGSDVELDDQVVDGAITIVAGVATETSYDRVRLMKGLIDGNPDTDEAVFDVPRWAEKMRVEVAEAGDTANPGTVTIGLIGRI